MLTKLLNGAAQNAKLALAGVAGAALVAGGSAVAISNVSDSTEATTPDATTPDATTVDTVTTSPSDTATATASPRNHGACVSAVARTKVEGETGREHGKRVSEAAKTCLKGDDSDAAEGKDVKQQRRVERTSRHAQDKAARKNSKADRSAADEGSDG